MSDIEKLARAISKLTREKALTNKIKFLEREIVILGKSKVAEIKPCGHEEHIEKLRARIKELESENQKLNQKLERIRAKTISD